MPGEKKNTHPGIRTAKTPVPSIRRVFKMRSLWTGTGQNSDLVIVCLTCYHPTGFGGFVVLAVVAMVSSSATTPNDYAMN